MNLEGLTDQQVQEKIRQGKVNSVDKKNSTTILKIVLENTLTIFNFVNLILAAMIIFVGSYKNLLFIVVAMANTLISIINSVRAKLTIDKMRLKTEQKPTVIRNGESLQIPQTEIVEGDLIIYSLKDQIIVDSVVEQGTVEVNESFITGEQDNIIKQKGDQLTSGSFVVSGNCKATVTAVGDENFINKLESNAHAIKPVSSKIFRLINDIVKYISFALIPIGILLLISRLNVPGTTIEIAVTSSVAALISMIPEGLVLLTSSVLALATIRLAGKKVLVQDLYSVETLARVDCIALDKTGTLTTGKMAVKKTIPAEGKEKDLKEALKLILNHQESDNATSEALKKEFFKSSKTEPETKPKEVIPFSSERKYSGVVMSDATFLMGAPEYLTNEKNNFPGNYRILAVVKISKKENKNQHPSKKGDSRFKSIASHSVSIKDTELLGYVLLEDKLRKDVKKIINYFYDNNIDVKIISGDNLRTVQNIASLAGVKDLSGINLSTLKGEINYEKLVKEYSIFTRVKPAQKKSLILALKKQGKTVAMTGDGVNDILAMKEADCSIAIGDGSDAARKSAKLVLLNSDFSAVPSIIAEGRQSINNLERSATLFLSKNTYAAILAFLFIFIPLEYPYAPLEMSLLNFACIGFPGVILALEKNTDRIKNQFVNNILGFAIPTGVTVAVAMVILPAIAKSVGFTRPELITSSAIITFAIDFLQIYSISRPLNTLRSTLLIAISTIVVLAFSIPYARAFLDFTLLSPDKILIVSVLVAASYFIFISARLVMRRLSPKIIARSRHLRI